MPKTALLFGSIGSVVETSDIQRRAYNRALQEAGVNWVWEKDTYAELLAQAGGKERLSMLASATGANLSEERIEKIHARKTEIACEELVRTHVRPRPGVAELVRLGKERGMKLAFVTTTYRPNLEAIFQAAGGTLAEKDFDTIVARSDVKHPKPAPDAYAYALRQLGIGAEDALAIEDTANSVMAAKRAGVTVVATPGEFTAGQDFWQADVVVDALSTHGAIDARVLALLD